jgi:hypothetical protein
VLDVGAVVLWAGYMHKVRSDPELLATHEAAYTTYRDTLQGLIAALRRDASAAQLRGEAIACNAVIDGLWLEGSILSHTFAQGEIVTIGLKSVGAILGVDLIAHSSMLPDPGKTLA